MRAAILWCARSRIERALMHRDKEDAGIVLDEILGAVAVVDVEIEDGDTRKAVMVERVSCADGDAAQKAETHSRCPLGMVAGGTDGAEGARGLAGQDEIDGAHHRTRGPQRGGERSG